MKLIALAIALVLVLVATTAAPALAFPVRLLAMAIGVGVMGADENHSLARMKPFVRPDQVIFGQAKDRISLDWYVVPMTAEERRAALHAFYAGQPFAEGRFAAARLSDGTYTFVHRDQVIWYPKGSGNCACRPDDLRPDTYDTKFADSLPKGASR